MKKFLATVLAMAMILSLSACGNKKVEVKEEKFEIEPLKGVSIDYTNTDNWLRFENNPTKDVDLFYIYPTCNMVSKDGTGIASLDDTHRLSANTAYMQLGSAFEGYTNVYAPFYRQMCFDGIGEVLKEDASVSAFIKALREREPRTDIYGALDYYFENINNGRPFIFAGHSQGTSMFQIVLSEYMKAHPEYLERMVAAYITGFAFDKAWIEANPHLKYATGEKDTGCIITWNTEGPDAKMFNFTLAKEDAYLINPLNWKTDETYASADECLGSLINGEIIPHYADAKIDLKRGTIVCTTCQDFAPESMWVLFGDNSLHIRDDALYYENIKANGLVRINEFFKNK